MTRLTEGMVRAKIAILNRYSKNKYYLNKWYNTWNLCCDGYGIVAEGWNGNLREVYQCVQGIIIYLMCEQEDRSKEN